MIFRTLAAGASLSAVFLSACSSSPPSNALGLPPIGANAKSPTVRPAFEDAAFVKIIFKNNFDKKMSVETLYAYPILPIFLPVEKKCIEPNQEWTSEVGFKYPDGQVAVQVLNDKCVHDPHSPRATVYVNNIHFTHAEPERATVKTNLALFRFVLKLCGHETDPVDKKEECAYMPQVSRNR